MMKSMHAALTAMTMMLAIPAQAQEPGIAETIAYIKERCDGVVQNDRPQKIEISHAGLFSTTTEETWRNSQDRDWKRVTRYYVDLKRVEFSASGDERLVVYSCGMAKCISEEDKHYLRDSSTGLWIQESSSDEEKFDEFAVRCNARDATLKAFKHLQKLLGGAKTVRDPFAD